MIAGIKDAFNSNLPQVKWMDEETKTKALNKVQLSLSFSPWSPQMVQELNTHYNRTRDILSNKFILCEVYMK